jgi:hypothetical protein
MHVYGQVSDDFKSPPPMIKWEVPLRTDLAPDRNVSDYKAVFDAAYKASKTIQVIEPDNKASNSTVISLAKTVLKVAKCVYTYSTEITILDLI